VFKLSLLDEIQKQLVANRKSKLTAMGKKLQKLDWQFVFTVSKCLGDSFNDSSWRFLKGEVLNRAIELASHHELSYVDRKGCDFLFNNDVRIEAKTQQRFFLKKSPHHTLKNEIQIKNTMSIEQNFERTFDFLLLVQTSPPYIAALSDWVTVEENGKRTDGQIKIERILEDDMFFITSEQGISKPIEIEQEYLLRQKIVETLDGWLSEIKNKYEDESLLQNELKKLLSEN
tara:strand:- start:19 stop:708 length:690 start_codon:yes stop_codon:yes gene_type:complete